MIEADRVARLVALASAAPSGDNCQPWSFRWDGAELAVRHDEARAAHVINHNRHGSYLTLGCVIESIRVAAGVVGLAAEARVTLDEPSWARVRLTEGGSDVDRLGDALASRATDRRLYLGGSLRDAVFDAVRSEAAQIPACGLHLTDAPPRELLDYVTEVDAFAWRQGDVYRDIMRWMRFTRAEVEATRDGIAWNGLGIDLPELPGLRLTSSPTAQRLIALAGVHRASRMWAARQLSSAAALYCITVRGREREPLVAAGRLGMRAWLRLEQAGYGVQPFTLASLLAYNLEVVGLPASTRPEFVALFRRGLGVLKRGFGLAEDELPIWIFRTGKSSPLPAHLRALRLPVERVLSSEGAGAKG